MSKTRPRKTSLPASDMMDTREVAAYLRLKERRIYDLARRHAIPHVRATGKLLFPRKQIDSWIAAKSATTVVAQGSPIVAGSHDPLLEWAVRESGSGLAILACGSRAGIERLARGEATVAAVHWRDPATGTDNIPLVRATLAGADIVVIEWARRAQGLLLARGNPLKVRAIADLAKKRLRVALRQPDAGSHRLFEHLLDEDGLRYDDLVRLPRPLRAETDLAAEIADGNAQAGFGIEAAARAHNLAFVPLAIERMDLVARRRDAFEPPMQALLAFARSEDFRAHARALGGYDVAAASRVVYNS